MTELKKTKMPYPARHRLIFAAVIWVLVIRTLILIAAGAIGIPDGWAFTINTALFLAIFIPLSVAAVKELREARARGDEPLPQIPTRRSLMIFGAFIAALWALFLWLVLANATPVFPLVPIIATIGLIGGLRRYHRAEQLNSTSGSESATSEARHDDGGQ